MKKIGIIVADSNELNEFPWDVKSIEKVDQFKFTIFNNGNIFVFSGIGIANAAAATQILITKYKVTDIWNYGAVGGNKHVDLYDLISPEKIFYHDVVTPWYKRGQTPGEKEFYKNSIKLEKLNNLASGSSFVTGREMIKGIKKELDCDIFDMETAGIAQIAYKNNVNIHIIKCVSDSIGHTDTNKVEDINIRIKKAGKISFDKTIEKINNYL